MTDELIKRADQILDECKDCPALIHTYAYDGLYDLILGMRQALTALESRQATGAEVDAITAEADLTTNRNLTEKPMNAKQQLEIGTEIHGGHFAGIVQIDGKEFGIVVAPKETGETDGKWGQSGEKIAATHIGDGLANTKVMAGGGSDIAEWALALNINDHQDWYIPARDELELIYRHLKPTSEENWCSFRDGENLSSVPLGLMYTEESPAQTTIEAFQKGGAEAMDDSWYWSSTQYSANLAFIQLFVGGTLSYDRKATTLRVRAVRRFIIN